MGGVPIGAHHNMAGGTQAPMGWGEAEQNQQPSGAWPAGQHQHQQQDQVDWLDAQEQQQPRLEEAPPPSMPAWGKAKSVPPPKPKSMQEIQVSGFISGSNHDSQPKCYVIPRDRLHTRGAARMWVLRETIVVLIYIHSEQELVFARCISLSIS